MTPQNWTLDVVPRKHFKSCCCKAEVSKHGALRNNIFWMFTCEALFIQRDRCSSIKVDQCERKGLFNGERSDVWQLFAPEGVADNVDNDHLKTLILFFFLSALPLVSACFCVANVLWIQVTAQLSEFVSRLHALKIFASLLIPRSVSW